MAEIYENEEYKWDESTQGDPCAAECNQEDHDDGWCDGPVDSPAKTWACGRKKGHMSSKSRTEKARRRADHVGGGRKRKLRKSRRKRKSRKSRRKRKSRKSRRRRKSKKTKRRRRRRRRK